jgi:uncharacterized protein YggE
MTEAMGGTNDGGGRVGRSTGHLAVTGLAVGALLVGGAALGLAVSNSGGSGPSRQASCSSSTPRLTVQGNGMASGTPDLLTAVLQITSNGSTAAKALSQNNAEVAAAVFALTKNGVAHADVQTTNLSLQPNYVYPKGVQMISGYAVSNTVTAVLHHTKTAGAAIDAVVTATGNSAQISSLTFSFNNPSTIEDKARTDAVHQATSHARAIARASGHKLGALCSLTDQTQATEPNLQQTFPNLGTVASAATSGAVPVSAGTQSETDQVKMVYAIEQP